jgi:long-chain fatty acid transport protein
MKIHRLVHLALLPAVLAPGLALATNGYLAHGYGVKAQGLAGAGIALPQDALAAATNPAGTAFVGERADIGATWFRPTRARKSRATTSGPDQSSAATTPAIS